MYYSEYDNGDDGENDLIRCALSKTLHLDHPRNRKAISVLDIPWTEEKLHYNSGWKDVYEVASIMNSTSSVKPMRSFLS